MQWAANLHYRRRDVVAVEAQAEALHAQATAQGVAVHAALGAFWRGWARAMQDPGDAGLAPMHQALTAVAALGIHIARPFCLLPLAEAAWHTGEVAEGLRLLDDALTELESTGQGYLLPEAHRLRGTFLLGQEDAVGAEACFRQALDVARRQQARSWELRAATSLGRLWHQQGKREEVHDLLADVYGWFTEGFDSIDLQEAHALLEQCSA
jgi:predicted ATPase